MTATGQGQALGAAAEDGLRAQVRRLTPAQSTAVLLYITVAGPTVLRRAINWVLADHDTPAGA